MPDALEYDVSKIEGNSQGMHKRNDVSFAETRCPIPCQISRTTTGQLRVAHGALPLALATRMIMSLRLSPGPRKWRPFAVPVFAESLSGDRSSALRSYAIRTYRCRVNESGSLTCSACRFAWRVALTRSRPRGTLDGARRGLLRSAPPRPFGWR